MLTFHLTNLLKNSVRFKYDLKFWDALNLPAFNVRVCNPGQKRWATLAPLTGNGLLH